MSRNKPKVSTKAYCAAEKEDRIIRVLADHPEGIYPKRIAFITKIKESTVKSILRSFELKDLVKKKESLRGIYQLVENSTHSIRSYNLHNLVLTYSSEEIKIREQVLENNSLNEIIKFRLVVGKETKKATMHVSTDYPFNFTSLCIVANLFQEKLRRICGITPLSQDIKISTFELNKDHYNIKLEGLNCITLTNAIAQFKLYQKERCVREEYKVTVPINLDLIDRLLRQGIVSADLSRKVDYQVRELSLLKKALNEFKGVLNTFINEYFRHSRN